MNTSKGEVPLNMRALIKCNFISTTKINYFLKVKSENKCSGRKLEEIEAIFEILSMRI